MSKIVNITSKEDKDQKLQGHCKFTGRAEGCNG